MNPTHINLAFADDHVLVRKGVISLLRQQPGIDVIIEACNGKELLEKIRTSKIKPDICLLDIRMPEMDGFDTLVELKKLWPHIGVLILTVFDNDRYLERMIANGANGYMVKTAIPEKLRQAIISIYTEGFYDSNMIARKFHTAFNNKKHQNWNISEIEKIFLKYCCTDLTYKEIADKMKTSQKSVEGHRDYLFKKLGINSRASLVMFAIQYGVVTIES